MELVVEAKVPRRGWLCPGQAGVGRVVAAQTGLAARAVVVHGGGAPVHRGVADVARHFGLREVTPVGERPGRCGLRLRPLEKGDAYERGQRSRGGYPPYEMRQIFFPPSSVKSSEPSGSSRSPTGRPHTSFFSGASMNPERKSCGGPAGRPSLKGMKTTL